MGARALLPLEGRSTSDNGLHHDLLRAPRVCPKGNCALPSLARFAHERARAASGLGEIAQIERWSDRFGRILAFPPDAHPWAEIGAHRYISSAPGRRAQRRVSETRETSNRPPSSFRCWPEPGLIHRNVLRTFQRPQLHSDRTLAIGLFERPAFNAIDACP